MSKYNTPVITDVGLKALREHAQSKGTFSISRVVAANNVNYWGKDEEYLRKLTKLEGTLYEGAIESVEDDNAYSFNIKFDNSKVQRGTFLTICAIGLYGYTSDSDEEQLFLVTNADSSGNSENLPEKENDITYTFTAHVMLDIDRAQRVTVKFNYNGYVKWADLNKHKEEAENTYAKKVDLNKHIEEADRKYIQSVNSVKRDNNGNVDVTDTITQDFPANITDVHELPAGNFRFTNLSDTQFNNLRNKPQGIDKYAFIKTFRRDGLGNSGDGWQLCFTTTDLEKVWYSGRNSGGWSDWKNIVNRSTYTDQELDAKLKEAGKVKTVNGISPDNSGNVDTHINEVVLGEGGMGFASFGKAEYIGKNLYLNPDKVLEGLTADNLGNRLVRKSEIQSFGNVKSVNGKKADNIGNVQLDVYTKQEANDTFGTVKTVNDIHPNIYGNVDVHISKVVLGKEGAIYADLGNATYDNNMMFMDPKNVVNALSSENIGDPLAKKSDIFNAIHILSDEKRRKYHLDRLRTKAEVNSNGPTPGLYLISQEYLPPSPQDIPSDYKFEGVAVLRIENFAGGMIATLSSLWHPECFYKCKLLRNSDVENNTWYKFGGTEVQ